jgi:exopolysaccharide production protein ExoQ
MTPLATRTGSASLASLVVGGGAFLVPLLLIYAPLGLAGLMPAILVLTVVARLIRRETVFRLDWILITIILAIATLILLSTIWSFVPDTTFSKAPRTAAALISGGLLIGVVSRFSKAERAVALNAAAIGIFVGLLCLAGERLMDGMFFPSVSKTFDLNRFLNLFNRALSVLAILVWPIAVHLERKKRFSGYALVGTFFALLFAFQTGAATAAVVLGATAFAICYAAPKWGSIALAGLTAGWIVLSPTIDQALPPPKQMLEELKIPRSSYHRLIIWNFASERIAERPLLGWGFNASRSVPGSTAEVDTFEPAMPLHPHNAALQWRLELGVPGALLGAALVVFAFHRIRRRSDARLETAVAAAATIASFAIAMLSFGIWQSWWVASLFLAATFCVLACGKPPDN